MLLLHLGVTTAFNAELIAAMTAIEQAFD